MTESLLSQAFGLPCFEPNPRLQAVIDGTTHERRRGS